METLEASKMLTLDDIFEMKQEELRIEMEKLGHDVKGLTKVQMQQALAKLISPVSSPKLGTKESGVQAILLQAKLKKEQDELARIQRKEEREAERQFELEKLKLQMDSEAKVKMEQAELESRRLEKEAEALERKMQMELQVKKEEEERRIQVKKEEAEATEKKLRIEAEILERKTRADNETRAMENEAKKVQLEAAERKLHMELEEKEKQRQHQLQMKELGGTVELLSGGHFEELAEGNTDRPGQSSRFNISSAVKFVPRFADTNLEHYLQSFEKAMELHQFQKDN